MTTLWPRLSEPVADDLFREQAQVPASAHPGQTFGEVGGHVSTADINEFRSRIVDIAAQYGFPNAGAGIEQRVRFDRDVSKTVRRMIDVTWAEASTLEVWSFVALVALPDITSWRWSNTPGRNRERWVAVDLSRHTWGRLWWHQETFREAPHILDQLNESEFNQIFERRDLGGRPRLAVELSRQLVSAFAGGTPRRSLTRDVTKRIRRSLAFIDPHALDDQQLAQWVASLVTASRVAITRQA
jgi:hypothetical protein